MTLPVAKIIGYSVGDKILNKYEELVEWYWQSTTNPLPLLFTTNPDWTSLEITLSLWAERPATDRLRHGTVPKLKKNPEL